MSTALRAEQQLYDKKDLNAKQDFSIPMVLQ